MSSTDVTSGKSQGGGVAYRYSDDEGTIHIVDALEAVPEKYRSVAKQIAIDGGRKAMEAIKDRDWPGAIDFVRSLDTSSVMVGFALGLIATLVLTVLRVTGKVLLKLGLVVLVGGLLMGAYFGWVRRSAGHSGGAISGPGPVLEDARRAVGAVRDRIQKDQEVLERSEKGTQ